MTDADLIQACEDHRRKREPIPMLPDTVLSLVERAHAAEDAFMFAHPESARIERAVRQRAYDDGYQDGRLDIERELEKRIAHLLLRVDLFDAQIRGFVDDTTSLQDQVDYWRSLYHIANAGEKRLRELLALQIEQADEAVDEAYKDGYETALELAGQDAIDISGE